MRLPWVQGWLGPCDYKGERTDCLQLKGTVYGAVGPNPIEWMARLGTRECPKYITGAMGDPNPIIEFADALGVQHAGRIGHPSTGGKLGRCDGQP